MLKLRYVLKFSMKQVGSKNSTVDTILMSYDAYKFHVTMNIFTEKGISQPNCPCAVGILEHSSI